MNQASAKRRNAVVAGAAAVALLIGGSTYALWSNKASFDGGEITAGDLALTARTPIAYDVSADRVDRDSETIADIADGNSPSNLLTFGADQVAAYNGNATVAGLDGDPGVYGLKAPADVLQGHVVNPTSWLIVPGDTAAVVTPYEITLKGDNLVAELTLDGTSFKPDDANPDPNTDMTYHYAIFGQDGQQIGSIQAIDTSNANQAIALFQADNTGQASGADDNYDLGEGLVPVPVIGSSGTDPVSITFVILAHFTSTENQAAIDDTVPNANKIDNLGNVGLSLTQVRTYTDGFGSPTSYPTPQA
jgi:alternate signal-mediated exported protein